MASRSIDSADVIQRRSYSGAGDEVDPVTRAIAEGRHSDRQEHLCQRCRNWCDGIWYGNKTYGIPDMCKRCYEDSGAAQMVLPIDPSVTREYIKPVEVRPYQLTLAEHLLFGGLAENGGRIALDVVDGKLDLTVGQTHVAVSESVPA